MNCLQSTFRVLVVFLPLAFCAPLLAASPEVVQGFVTDVRSPTDFQMGSLHVVLGSATTCDTDELLNVVSFRTRLRHGFFWQSSFELQESKVEDGPTAHDCETLGLTVGTRVEATGEVDPGSGQLTATRVTLHHQILYQDFGTQLDSRPWSTRALLEETPQVTHTAAGWKGKMWIGGYPTDLNADTELHGAPAGSEVPSRRQNWFNHQVKDNRAKAAAVSPFSPELLQPNTWADYIAFPEQDSNGISLTNLRMWPNSVLDLEKRYVSRFGIEVRQDGSAQTSTAVVMNGKTPKTLKILSDPAIQQFVSETGNAVVPAYQKLLPDADPAKIHFRFYVVSADRETLEDLRKPLDGDRGFRQEVWKFAAIGMPDGTVLVADWALASWKTTAQLAAMLSYAITNVLQKDSYLGYHVAIQEGLLTSSVEDGSNFSYILGRDEQQLRIASRQMYLAGYDIRELPAAMGAADGHYSVELFEEGTRQENPLWYAAYLFDYLGKYYKTSDFAGLKTDSAPYAAFLTQLQRADPAAFKNMH